MENIELWNGRQIPRIGIGTWAAGGLTIWPEGPVTYGEADDEKTKDTIRLAYELGCRIFDTAPAYGAGNAELLLGEALKGKDDVVITTKCGLYGDPKTRTMFPMDVSAKGIRTCVEGSLRRLQRDQLSIVLLHVNGFPPADAGQVFEELQRLRSEGKLQAFGWSTDHIESLQAFADLVGFEVVENDFNIFDRAPEIVGFAEQRSLISLGRLPLAMGLLSGKYSGTRTLSATDVRSSNADWLKFFKSGAAAPEYLDRLNSVREILMSDGRTLAQGALCWILAKSPRVVPVPGFTRPEQVVDNLGALEKGPLSPEAMQEVDRLLALS